MFAINSTTTGLWLDDCGLERKAEGYEDIFDKKDRANAQLVDTGGGVPARLGDSRFRAQVRTSLLGLSRSLAKTE